MVAVDDNTDDDIVEVDDNTDDDNIEVDDNIDDNSNSDDENNSYDDNNSDNDEGEYNNSDFEDSTDFYDSFDGSDGTDEERDAEALNQAHDFSNKGFVPLHFNEKHEKSMALLSYLMKHHLSGQATSDLMDLFNIFNINETKDTSVEKIKETIGACDVSIIDYCEKCFTLFPEDKKI